MADVRIEPFSPRYAGAFREINLAWIRALFRVEAHDEEVLSDPSALLRAGGQIFIALDACAPALPAASEAQVDADDPAVLGVVALLRPSASGDARGFEFAKMGVRESARGKGIGRLLGEAALAHARAQGASLVDILSNRRLGPALALYRSLGFIEQPLPPNDYERADIYLTLHPCAALPPLLPPPALPLSLQQQLRSDAATYCACYCEENVLRLAAHPLAAPFLADPAYVCLISNPAQQVALLQQHAGAGRRGGLVVWDYHVILLTRTWVLDLDSTLEPFPTPTAAYLTRTCSMDEELLRGSGGSDGGGAARAAQLAPRFRLLPLQEYRACFASDRRHMVGEDGSFMAQPPPWPVFKGERAASAHTLGELLRMEPGAAAGEGSEDGARCGGALLLGVGELLAALH